MISNTISNYRLNFEDKNLDELKEIRKGFNLKNVRPEDGAEAFLIFMIDILLEKFERLENDNK